MSEYYLNMSTERLAECALDFANFAPRGTTPLCPFDTLEYEAQRKIIKNELVKRLRIYEKFKEIENDQPN